MSVLFRSAGGPPDTTTFAKHSAISVVIRELPADFVARLVVVFQRTAGVTFERADLPPPLFATSATLSRTYLVAIAIIRADENPLHRVMGPAHKAVEGTGGGETRGARSRSRGEASRGGIQRARSAPRRNRGRKMSAELQAEIVSVAAALADTKQAGSEKPVLDDFEEALRERDQAVGRDAVGHFVFTDQIECDGAAHPDSSKGESESGEDSGAEGRAVYTEAVDGLKIVGEFIDRSDEDSVDEEGSSLCSFIDDKRVDADGCSEVSPSGRSR